ncbi:MAG: FecCD family ABC transporter permease [Candidatus Sumerlaeaceae bacterium]
MSAHKLNTAGSLALHVNIGLILTSVLVLAIPFVGSGVDVWSALREGPFAEQPSPSGMIFWQTRLPRVLAALGSGAALAMAGVAFQAILRNPLAEPYILGISGGAALGKAVVLLLAGGVQGALIGMTNGGAFLGALAPVLILHGLRRRRRHWSSETVLLAGVVMNVLASALLLLIQFFSDFTLVRQMFAWTLGGLDIVGYQPLVVLWPAVILGGVILTWLGRALNVLALGTMMATHLGVNVHRVVAGAVWLGALLTATSVAVAGPIGFVGLLVPHILRAFVGSDHRRLIPLSAIYGGLFLLVCDFLGWRGLELFALAGVFHGHPSEIPVGIITACVGGIFFLWLLFRREDNECDL